MSRIRSENPSAVALVDLDASSETLEQNILLTQSLQLRVSPS